MNTLFEINDVPEPNIQRDGNIHRVAHQQTVVTA
jgi:hypothetical protein